MIECIFTLDYEIYGGGEGSLNELVYEPAERLRQLFLGRGVRFVNFVEVLELEKIEEAGSDPAIGLVKRQVRDLHLDGFETGLHLHPWWCNASYKQGRWVLDSSEYNLCTLPRARIVEIVDRALGYVRRLVDGPSFTPVSFRAGAWMFQPTQPAASVLAEKGLRIDSSVYKGALEHHHGLDYRPALRNGDYWRFDQDVARADPGGTLVEVPIYAEMVPSWRMLTTKRMTLHKRVQSHRSRHRSRLSELRNRLRPRYPLKLDFCRMTLDELTGMMDRAARHDREDPEALRPIVAIGHTKDLVDLETVERFLSYLESQSIPVTTFADLYPRLPPPVEAVPTLSPIGAHPGQS